MTYEVSFERMKAALEMVVDLERIMHGVDGEFSTKCGFIDFHGEYERIRKIQKKSILVDRNAV